MCLSSPKVPVSQPVETPADPPTAVSDEVIAAREDEKRRAATASGAAGTNLTGGLGLSNEATTAKKSLLGQG